MSSQVVFLPQAYQDIDRILTFLRARSRQGAIAWEASLNAAKQMLRENANGCGVAPEDVEHSATIQQVFFKTRRGRRYRIVFTIKSNTVFVMHVRGASQNLIDPDELRLP